MNNEAAQMLDQIITPVNKGLGLWSPAADRLVLCTCEVESGFDAVRQVLNSGKYGAAFGPSQMEKATFDYLVDEYIPKRRPDLIQKIWQTCYLKEWPGIEGMIWNLRFAVAMCRIRYVPVPEPLPDVNDIEGMGRYWLKYYNGNGAGKGTIERFVNVCKPLFTS